MCSIIAIFMIRASLESINYEKQNKNTPPSEQLQNTPPSEQLQNTPPSEQL